MGYEMRRELRVALGPKITGLQRAIALEIADDAREETRVSLATLENLALWTGAKDVNVVRNALKRLAAEGWEFRVPLGTGKDGRTLYAVPGKRITFKVPKFEGVAGALPSEGVAPAPSEGAPARSQGAGARSERAGATPFSSSPQTPHLSSGPSAAAPAEPEESEREVAAPKDEPLPDPAESVALAWREARGGAPVRHTEIQIRDVAAQLLADGHDAGHLRSVAAWMAARGYVRLAEAVTHREAPAPAKTAAGSRPGLPPWCGQCGDEFAKEAARLNPRFRTIDGDTGGPKCPDCHPDMAAQSANSPT